MTETMIKSYFRIDGEFIPIEEFSGTLPDTDYIDGAIVCTINGQELLQLEHWDLVDQLWAYIVNGLTELIEGKEVDVCFPDQPMELRFALISSTCVEVTIGKESIRVDYNTFRSALKYGALEFFDKMKEIAPELSGLWNAQLKKAEMIPS